MSLNYTTYQAALSELMVIPTTNADFIAILPDIIDYAEQRIYRELDFLNTITVSTANMSANTRSITIPSSMVVLQSMNVVTPASTAPNSGTRVPLQRVSLEFLNYVWPTAASDVNNPLPQYYAVQDQSTVVLAPTPYDTYMGEFVGTIRPAPLSASNTTTFLATNLPDLFLAASMIFASGFQRDFGSQSEDPQTGQSWEAQYQNLKTSAMVEEMRKKSQSVAWTPMSPTPLANPPRP